MIYTISYDQRTVYIGLKTTVLCKLQNTEKKKTFSLVLNT